MRTFEFYNPTRIIFGKDVCENVGEELKKYASTILLVYGRESAKANGVYQRVKKVLLKAELSVYELAGVQANPRLSFVKKGIEIAKKEQIEMILAIGGGSVIDTAKQLRRGCTMTEMFGISFPKNRK